MFVLSIIPKSRKVTIELPNDFVGEEVRIIAVVEKSFRTEENTKKMLEDIRKTYAAFPRINLSDFKFNRNETNNFDE